MTAQCDLPIHPFTGLTAVGFRLDGRPVWPIKGGSEDADEQPDTDEQGEQDTETDDTDDSADGEDKLGDAGKQALDRMKQQRNTERAKRRALEQQLADLQAKGGAKGDGDQLDPDAIRAEAKRDAEQAALQRILRSEVKAAAAGKLADPADAYKFIDLDQFEVGDDGSIDEDDIADAIEDLLKSKPYLAAQGGGSKKQHGSADGGARKGSRPGQLTRDQLKSMTPDQIEEARLAGRLNDLMGIK